MNLTPKELTPCKIYHICHCAFKILFLLFKAKGILIQSKLRKHCFRTNLNLIWFIRGKNRACHFHLIWSNYSHWKYVWIKKICFHNIQQVHIPPSKSFGRNFVTTVTANSYLSYYPADIHLLKVKIRNIRTRCEICPKVNNNDTRTMPIALFWCLYC